ncbi:MAG: hypothetical protein ACOCWQ_04235 [Nanoarchaeota archaeon]
MAEKVERVGVQREKGYLYFIDGNGDVARAKMARGASRRKGSEVVKSVGVQKESGYLYFIDKQGDISRVKMARGRK